jgi:DnaJ-class molecular chaperone
MSDFYKILNISRTSSANEIKNAYRKLALIYHPDVNGGDKSKTESFKKILAAYETLKDDNLRYKYDNESKFNVSTSYYSTATVRKSPSDGKKGPVDPRWHNEAEWLAWHYGVNATSKPFNAYTKVHYENVSSYHKYYARQRAHEEATQRDKEKSRREASDALKYRRNERLREANEKSKESSPSSSDACNVC